MSATVDENSDFTAFNLPPLDAPSPPSYDETKASPIPSTEAKAHDDANSKHAPWLLRRTSVHVESRPSNVLEDNLSANLSIPTTKSDKKRAVRNLLSRFGRQPSKDLYRDDGVSVADSHETSLYGTTVSIEAAQPRKTSSRQREMRGLEQAASVKRWAGNGKPAEAWGKLLKDPELWDPKGDTLVYFSYQRPEPSFRIRSSLLEATESDVLIGKLQDGQQRTSKAYTSYPSPPDIQDLNIGRKGHQGTPSVAESNRSGIECPIRYKIHFPPPDGGSKTTVLRHHITTRNFFAMLSNRPPVGLTFYQALVDLHQRLQLYMPRQVDCTQLLITYLTNNHLHNVSNEPAAAAGLLAWSEDPEVRWRDGWREGFVHCCGMYVLSKDLPECRDISHATRTFLERAHLELEARIEEAQAYFSEFSFDNMWARSEVHLHHPCRAIFDQFRRFLQQYYTKANKHWPPHVDGEFNQNWLTSDLVFRLQRDFAALYEYHVDRNVIWDKSKDHETMHQNVVRKANKQLVDTGPNELCLAKLLSRFDEKHRYPHIPHPFPLLPDLALVKESKHSKTHFFSSKSKASEKRIIHAFLEASNATVLGPDIATNGLAEAFLRFEKTDNLGDADPVDARKARWLLLYAVLQVLATLSVDTPDLFFTEGVSYFLNPRLKGTPPWRTDPKEEFQEASARSSYCWVAPEISWGDNGPPP